MQRRPAGGVPRVDIRTARHEELHQVSISLAHSSVQDSLSLFDSQTDVGAGIQERSGFLHVTDVHGKRQGHLSPFGNQQISNRPLRGFHRRPRGGLPGTAGAVRVGAVREKSLGNRLVASLGRVVQGRRHVGPAGSVDIRALRDEKLDHFLVVADRGENQRRIVSLASNIDVGTAGGQQFDCFQATRPSGYKQRCFTPAVGGPDICSLSDQRRDHLLQALADSKEEDRLTAFGLCPVRGFRGFQHIFNIRRHTGQRVFLRQRDIEESRLSRRGHLGVDVRSMGDQQLRDIPLPDQQGFM